MYHVTPTRNLPRIRKQGLRRFQTSQWLQAGTGERYGSGEIFAFDHLHDALRWAGKMDWDLHQATGTGKIAIVEFDGGPNPWEVDHSDPLSQAGRKGQWLRSMYPVPAPLISNAIIVDRDALALLRGAA